MTKHLTLTVLPAFALLAACATPPASPTAGPGNRAATASEVAGLFATVCVANRSDLSNVPTTLSTLPVTQNTGNDLYFHNALDLSFAVFVRGNDAACSMVWGSSDGNRANEQAILTVAPDAVIGFPDDNRLFSARINGAF